MYSPSFFLKKKTNCHLEIQLHCSFNGNEGARHLLLDNQILLYCCVFLKTIWDYLIVTHLNVRLKNKQKTNKQTKNRIPFVFSVI